MPQVSVIIPNYNHSLYLQERIDSVLEQSFQDFEVIILDDQSTDNSKNVIEQYRNHLKVSQIIYNETNSGSTFRQWKKGFGIAKGKYIWIAESDDVADPNLLRTLVLALDSDDAVTFSFCRSVKIDSHSQIMESMSWFNDLGKRNWMEESFINDGKEEIRNYLFFKNIVPNASAVLINKKYVNENIFTDISNMKYAGDWYFWVKLAEQGKIAYSAEALNKFRQHQNTTRSIKNPDKEIIRFGEYFFVIKYVQKKYNLSWNLSKHSWILREYLDKKTIFDKKAQIQILSKFPFRYARYLILNSLKKK